MNLSRRLALGLAGAAWAVPSAYAAAPLTCGAALPLSGAAGLQGSEILRGIQLAADAVNAAGGIAGKPLQLRSTDMPAPGDATAAVNGLITGGHAAVMFGSGDSALSYPASAAAELAQTPFIELTAPADGITSRGFKFLLRFGPSTAMAAGLAVATLQARFAGRNIGLLYNSGTTGAAFAAAFNAALAAAKLPVTLVVGYPEGIEDLHDQAGRLMRAKVDVLLHAAGLDDALGLVLASRALGWRPGALLGYGAGYAYRETVAALPGGIEGAYVVAAPFYPAPAAAIGAAYRASYGTAPRAADSLTAYTGAKLVFDTLNASNGDATKLLGALRQARLPQGGLANGFGVQFDHDGQNTGAYVTLQQWRGDVLTAL
ncbi:ABC transporter substrate-binding protein [Acidocella sp.]|uniref:ABC transporter substrate-binding protein n=1 Tax=Acidocella sp. TaxID=50710 RepID=UPI0026298E1D|nr:ABC transporter substrate-binding protein [Acidocella sp.]